MMPRDKEADVTSPPPSENDAATTPSSSTPTSTTTSTPRIADVANESNSNVVAPLISTLNLTSTSANVTDGSIPAVGATDTPNVESIDNIINEPPLTQIAPSIGEDGEEELGGSESNNKKDAKRGDSTEIEIETIDADDSPPLTPWQVADSFDDNGQGDEEKDDVIMKKMMKSSTVAAAATASAAATISDSTVVTAMATHGSRSTSTEMMSQPQQHQRQQHSPPFDAAVNPDPNYLHEALQATAVDYELYEATLVPSVLVVEAENRVNNNDNNASGNSSNGSNAINATTQPLSAHTSFWQRKWMLCIIVCAFLIIGALAGVTGTLILSQRAKSSEGGGTSAPSGIPSNAPTSFQSCQIASAPISHDEPSPYFEFYIPKFDGNGSVTETADADGTVMRICSSGGSAINDEAHFFSYSRVDSTLPSVSLSFRLDEDLPLPITNDRFDGAIFRPEIGIVIRLVDGNDDPSPQSQPFAGMYFASGRSITISYRESDRVSVVEPIADIARFGKGSWLELTKTGGIFLFKYKLRDDAPWILAKEMTLTDFDDFSDKSLEAGIAATNGSGGQRSDYDSNAEFTISHVDITPYRSYFDPVSDENINGADGTYEEVGSSISRITENGRGGDIWNAADSFFFHYDELSTDALDFGFDASVFVEGLTVDSSYETYSWAKGGLMVRESLDKASPHFSVFQTGSYGVRVQYRKYG
ncbi:hypothetical protein ACHAXS_001228, partial [Conticribra weissflogii]